MMSTVEETTNARKVEREVTRMLLRYPWVAVVGILYTAAAIFAIRQLPLGGGWKLAWIILVASVAVGSYRSFVARVADAYFREQPLHKVLWRMPVVDLHCALHSFWVRLQVRGYAFLWVPSVVAREGLMENSKMKSRIRAITSDSRAKLRSSTLKLVALLFLALSISFVAMFSPPDSQVFPIAIAIGPIAFAIMLGYWSAREVATRHARYLWIVEGVPPARIAGLV